MSRRRTPRPIAAAVSAALEGAEPATLLAAVQSAWSDAVGEAIAREATPISEKNGVVTVACRSSTWAQELELLGPRILEQVSGNLPSGTVLDGLRFTAARDPD